MDSEIGTEDRAGIEPARIGLKSILIAACALERCWSRFYSSIGAFPRRYSPIGGEESKCLSGISGSSHSGQPARCKRLTAQPDNLLTSPQKYSGNTDTAPATEA